MPERRKFSSALSLLFLMITALPLFAEEEFSFELNEFEKKSLKWGGYTELEWEHMDIDQGSAFTVLNLSKSLSTLDRYTGSLQIDGRYDKALSSFNWLLKAAAQQDNIGWDDMTDVYEAYLSVKPTPSFTGSFGKKSYKWGKGYAWNPVGFINRTKDPNNPEESLEGYITTEADLIRSFTGSLQIAALTTVMLPVSEDVNDDFGETNNINIAAKLYILYLNTDIDFILYTGNSRSRRYGIDFSRNLATNFEIHGEAAYMPNHKKITLQDDYSVQTITESVFSYLLGLRYLSENDITSIVEYYHNDAGYTEKEMDRFFQLVVDGETQHHCANIDTLLEKARDMSLKGYGKPQPGRNYLYGRFTQKEPFDILYFTPGITTIFNLDDSSYSLSPEMIYTGFTNWELRLRFTYLQGSSFSEYGEKLSSNKLELRVRYFF
ncbi:hypothetical protein [Desulfobacter postgatei]|jgi:hypothetical protein|uniref:hypothetical protein n=1 Tax=Desulfobacter postgatei TaxID=2293 RepID=UPI002A35AF7F|nr:hypothetical protein [Desulfobacter postgatei]MDX9962311.1 hypothetical protein [Desulfobacter postgatei]